MRHCSVALAREVPVDVEMAWTTVCTARKATWSSPRRQCACQCLDRPSGATTGVASVCRTRPARALRARRRGSGKWPDAGSGPRPSSGRANPRAGWIPRRARTISSSSAPRWSGPKGPWRRRCTPQRALRRPLWRAPRKGRVMFGEELLRSADFPSRLRRTGTRLPGEGDA